jgi:mono/diheme cytochrome c family protein
MSDKTLYSYTGIFNTPDQIINAAEKAAEEGITKYDVNTPYPIHGMDKAMKLPPSKLGYVALVFGLSAALATALVLGWMSAIDYPIVIGGKPLFSFPAYVPIMFEVTVLTASIATVVAMLFFFFKLPNNSHPLHGTDYMKKVSSDKYGISIQVSDPKFILQDGSFDEKLLIKFLESAGALEIAPVYWDEEEINHENKILEPKFIAFLFAVAVITCGATYFSLNILMNITPFNWMADQQKLSAQQRSSIFKNNSGMLVPVPGTVARNKMPYQFAGQPDLAGQKLVNPIPVSKESLKLGQVKFDIYCSPCHGFNADGNSRLHGQFPNPPTLHSDKIRNWTDARIFAVITEGQNVMPSYASQLTVDERWSVINYVRSLQRALNARESDVQ